MQQHSEQRTSEHADEHCASYRNGQHLGCHGIVLRQIRVQVIRPWSSPNHQCGAVKGDGLSFANSRFTERVQGTLSEANAIGTAWLRADAIGHERGLEIARLLEEYTQLRRDFVSEAQDQSTIDELNRRTNALQSKIWGHVAAITSTAWRPGWSAAPF
ncbi:MAG TPA: hypothetical protein VKB76_01615 [Ktedonobacterales bacterium]|nr:hypothetical protein [Ktedonobacterales bacterium]